MKFNTDNKSHGIAINGTDTPWGIPNWKTSPEVLWLVAKVFLKLYMIDRREPLLYFQRILSVLPSVLIWYWTLCVHPQKPGTWKGALSLSKGKWQNCTSLGFFWQFLREWTIIWLCWLVGIRTWTTWAPTVAAVSSVANLNEAQENFCGSVGSGSTIGLSWSPSSSWMKLKL